jgi:hypothetical protein
MSKVSYSLDPMNRPPIIFAFFVVMLVVGLSTLTVKNGPPTSFTAAWLLILAWNAYWLLFRVSYRVEVVGNQFRWFTPLNRGEFAIDDLVSVDTVMLDTVSRFKRKSGPSVLMIVRRGLPQFTEEVQRLAPEVTVSWGGLLKLRTMGFWNGFRKE